MTKSRARLVCLAAVIMLAAGAPRAQSPSRPDAKSAALTAMDYIEIRQLVARSSYTIDQLENNGEAFAALFTPDGVLTQTGAASEIKGRAKLAAFARADIKNQGPLWFHSFLTNHVITPSPQGATGRVYFVDIEIAEAGSPGAIQTGGRFDDVYAKTAEGWRIKQRTVVPAALGPRPPDPPSRGQ
jgi:hypothetical protein